MRFVIVSEKHIETEVITDILPRPSAGCIYQLINFQNHEAETGGNRIYYQDRYKL